MILKKIVMSVIFFISVHIYAEDNIYVLERPALWINADGIQFKELIGLADGESVSRYGSEETEEYVLFQCNNFGKFTRTVIYRKKDGTIFESLFPVEYTYGQYILQTNNRKISIHEINVDGTFKEIKIIDFAKTSNFTESYQTFHGDFVIDYSLQSEYYLTIFKWDALELVKYYEISEPVLYWYMGKNSLYYVKSTGGYSIQDRDLVMINLDTLESTLMGKEYFHFINGLAVSGYNGQTGFIDLQTDKQVWFSGDNIIEDHHTKIISIGHDKYPVRNIITITDRELIFTSTEGIYSYSLQSGMIKQLYNGEIKFSGYFRNEELYCSNAIQGAAYIFSLSKKRILYQFNLKWVDITTVYYYDVTAVDFFPTSSGLFMFAVIFGMDNDK